MLKLTKQQVKDIQYLLAGHNRQGLRLYHGKIDGEKGPKTDASIREAKWLMGYPKNLCTARFKNLDRYRTFRGYLVKWTQRGVRMRPRALVERGEKRRKARERGTSRVQNLLRVAAVEIGVHESPAHSNSGEMVRQFQAATFLGGSGWPWCVAFVQWCFAHARVPFPYRSAGAWDLNRWARQVGWAHSTPLPGDVAIWGPGCGMSQGHGSIVEKVIGGQIHSIDGNVSDSVARRVRSRSCCFGATPFVRHPGLRGAKGTPLVVPPAEILVGSDGEEGVPVKVSRTKAVRQYVSSERELRDITDVVEPDEEEPVFDVDDDEGDE